MKNEVRNDSSNRGRPIGQMSRPARTPARSKVGACAPVPAPAGCLACHWIRRPSRSKPAHGEDTGAIESRGSAPCLATFFDTCEIFSRVQAAKPGYEKDPS